ncbi:hypothetical protein C5U48_05425 [Mycolicibacter virginiensis]|uniref:Uncharacterized protein n=1 Tax=Mycolicibacter virginiensis TaxID=1795032 RepID=A0A9X7IQ34_9MYCO|nr:hypothetical protein [Mycolicibacter virginiensis]PQM53314.1 hypothetical protein C5U48_05425 [Mycolicibacter virginiensis]
MSEYTLDDQWRSFQTFIATYIAGMVHPRDVFTISPKSAIMPPLVEFRCDAAGRLRFGVGALSWSDEDGANLRISREKINQVAAQTAQLLREQQERPSELRLSGSGPASSVAVLARSGFFNGDISDPTRLAAYETRMSAEVDVEGDAIDAAARAVGQRVFEKSRNASFASIAFANALASLRTWVDPFSSTPKTGIQVGVHAPRETEHSNTARTDGPQEAPAT